MGGWFRKEIKTLDDLKGLKLRDRRLCRHDPVASSAWCRSSSPAGDIYPALEKGTIDAAEWVGPYDDEKLGFHKVAQYYYYPGWWEGCGQAAQLSSTSAKWNELPKTYQAIVARPRGDAWRLGAGASTTTSIRRRSSAWSPAARSCGRSRSDVLEACYKAAQRSTPSISQTNPTFKKLLRQPDGRSAATRTSGCRWPSSASTAS